MNSHLRNVNWIGLAQIQIYGHKVGESVSAKARERERLRVRRKTMQWKIQKIGKHTVSCFGFTANANINTHDAHNFSVRFFFVILFRHLSGANSSANNFKCFSCFFFTLANMSAAASVAREKPFICNEMQCHGFVWAEDCEGIEGSWIKMWFKARLQHDVAKGI